MLLDFEKWGSDLVYPCDVEDRQIEDLMSGISDAWDGIDGIVTASPLLSELDGNYVDITYAPGSCWHMKLVPTVSLPSQKPASSCPDARGHC